MKSRAYFLVRLMVLGVLVAALCVAVGCGTKEEAEPQTATDEATTTMGKAVDSAKEAAGEVVTLANPEQGVDPVCGMKIADHRLVVEIDGKKYGFCSAECAEKFKEDPAKYLTADAGHEGHDH